MLGELHLPGRHILHPSLQFRYRDIDPHMLYLDRLNRIGLHPVDRDDFDPDPRDMPVSTGYIFGTC
jgi:hypothetical protein